MGRPNHTDRGSLTPGQERPGQYVDPFRLRGGAPSLASLTPTPITPARTHPVLKMVEMVEEEPANQARAEEDQEQEFQYYREL